MGEYFVQIPNKMFAFGSEYFVTNDELLVYYHLAVNVSARDTKKVITNIELLHSMIELEKSNKTRGKNRIRVALLNLKNKGYIQFNCLDSALKNTSYLEVRLFNTDNSIFVDKVRCSNWTYYGFTEITHEFYVKANNPEQFKVLIYTKWRSFINSDKPSNYRISYDEWESILNVSHQTAVKIIKSCVENGLIIKERGQYYLDSIGKPKQQTNKYTLNKESNNGKGSASLVEEVSESTENRSHQWFTRNSILNVNDMYIYLTTDCETLKQLAAKRIEGISKSSNGKQSMEKLMNEAQAKINRDGIDAKLVQLQEEEQRKEIIEELSRPQSKYQSKDTRDYSYFLDDKPTNQKEDEFGWCDDEDDETTMINSLVSQSSSQHSLSI
ncbi:hypothetical protein M1K46_02400 [Fictibacillus sp. WQ 8-8]|uniref:hypothetical protein n=1 Tax=Fictibacillus sp. WQ 8-8 TaxID=2938788 RepID=UPI00210E6DEC|nr:hypothetical protein [Fictibacillus sp. WQ 8-8]MCQ6264517.1 hypothetical protein [Fictibacillus sp. WQ 8-8]